MPKFARVLLFVRHLVLAPGNQMVSWVDLPSTILFNILSIYQDGHNLLKYTTQCLITFANQVYVLPAELANALVRQTFSMAPTSLTELLTPQLVHPAVNTPQPESQVVAPEPESAVGPLAIASLTAVFCI